MFLFHIYNIIDHKLSVARKKLKVSTQGILKKLTKNWKTAPVSKVIAAKKAPATTVDTAGKVLCCRKIPCSSEEIEIEDETEEELERQRQEELQRDEELTRILRDVKLPGISAIATAATAIAENLPAATTPKKPGRPRAATAVAEKPAEKTGRTRAAVIEKAGQKGGQKRPAASAKGPAKKRKVIDQVPYDEPSEDEEQEEVPATSSAPAEKKILKNGSDSEDPAFDAEKEEDEESEEVEVVQEKKTTLKKPKAEEKRMVLYEREPIKKIVKRKTEFSVAKKKKRRKKRMKRKLEVRQEEAMSNSCIGLRK
ncbi:histone H1-like [Chenopodium quinoa]|uniref:histone H1-like n=1 Tax=Chenopodium quinoa TaxID=63459 RepID=UPI000B78C4B7|nr:histone H1-like [Chenopodium quinoa]